MGRQYPGQGAQKPPGVTIVAISPHVNQLPTGREGGQGSLGYIPLKGKVPINCGGHGQA